MSDDFGEKQKDPWSGKNKNQGPPDLDKVFKDMSAKLTGAFGKKRKKPSGPNGNGGGNDGDDNTPSLSLSARSGGMIIGLVIIVLIVIWFLSGLYIVQPAEQAVVLRFGKYVQTQNPGLHWIPRFIDSKTIVNIQQVNTFGYQSEMLTEDENIVSVEIAVQFQISNPYDYLYSVADPVKTLEQATASALRQVVGNMTLNTVLTTGRQELSAKVDQQLKAMLAGYKTGINIVAVTLQPTKPPEQVTAAFNDAIRAREDEVRYQNQADAYASRVVPIADGQAKRIIAEAKAFEQQIVLNAKAHIASFNALLPQYQQAPKVTRERMYFDTMENVLSNSSKILVATSKNNQNMMYLPLQKLMNLPNLSNNTSDDSISNETQRIAAAASTVTSPNTSNSSDDSGTSNASTYGNSGYSFADNQGGQ